MKHCMKSLRILVAKKHFLYLYTCCLCGTNLYFIIIIIIIIITIIIIIIIIIMKYSIPRMDFSIPFNKISALRLQY